MLAPPDLELVRRDPALPGLGTVLDAERFLEALRRSTRTEVRAAEIAYLRYKPGMNCVAAYRLTSPAGEVMAYAKAYGPDAKVKIGKARQRPAAPTPLGIARVAWPEVGVVACIFPNDDKLKSLVRWPPGDFLAGLHLDRLVDTVEALRYKPERRLVARADAAGVPVAVVKVYTRAGYRRAKESTARLAERGALRLPRLLARSKPLRALAFDWVEGRPLADAIRAGETQPVAEAGAALAEIHQQGPGKSVSPALQLAALRATAREIAVLCPELAWLAGRTAQRLVERLVPLPASGALVHGDFYAGQVVLGTDGPVLLDLDRVAGGEPAADLGNFLAHLERENAEGRLPVERFRLAQTALLAGYVAVSPWPDHVGLHAAAALFRRCSEPFRYRVPDWPRRMAAFVARTQAVLEEAIEPCPVA